jgi:hypothetical protein
MKLRHLTHPLKAGLSAIRYQIQQRTRRDASRFPSDFSPEDVQEFLAVERYTLTGPERIYSLIRAVEYVVDHGIPGDIVECGVWKGGSMMAIARTLKRKGDLSRNLYLFDTFEGMSAPTDADVAFDGESAHRIWGTPDKRDPDAEDFTNVPLDAVKEAVFQTGYPRDRFRFVQGKVEDTIPEQAPERIALLRLDTDWYESTRHELVHLFPRLERGGVLVVDDYGHWLGARKATDEYLREARVPILLHRVDYTCRFAVKP